MPDFTVQFVGGTQVPWIDVASDDPQAASRLFADPDHLRNYRRFIPPATVTIRAVVDGVAGPADVDLDGRLFTAAWVEYSGDSRPPIAQAVGTSAVCTIAVTTAHLGHFILRLRREGGGGVLVPFDVESP